MQQKNVCFKIIPFLIITFLGLIVFMIPIGSGDELWNYNFSRCIAKGMLPYRDFSIVQTPLSAYLPAFLMKLFGTSLFIHRVAAYFLFVAIFASLYYVCKLINNNSFAATLWVLFAITLIIWVYLYNYNHLMILVLFEIYALTLKNKRTMAVQVALGTLSGVTILIKQNTGLAIMGVNFLICLAHVLKGKERKTYSVRAMVSLIPGTLFFIYLLSTKTLNDFWDYAVYGVTTFKHRFTIMDLMNRSVLVGGVAVLFFISVVYVGIMCWKDSENKQGRELGLYALAGLSVVYPLCDGAHLVAGFISVIPAFCFYLKKPLKGYARTAVVTAVMVACFFSYYLMLPLESDMQPCRLRNYEGLYYKTEFEDIIEQVDDYVKEKEREGHTIRIADEIAVFFTIPLDTYTKNWDMLLVGNLGRNGVEELLDEDGDVWYLVRKDDDTMGEQSYFELIHYVKDNYKKVDEVLNFEVYEKAD